MKQISNLKKQIEKYVPYNEQEESDKEIMLKSLEIFDDMLTRENKICHIIKYMLYYKRNRDDKPNSDKYVHKNAKFNRKT